MEGILRKLILAAAIAVLGIGFAQAVQTGSRDSGKTESQAIAALAKLKIPLQRDSKGIVRWIEATEGEFSDEAMPYLSKLPRLEWLEIGGGSVSAAGIAQLKSCTALRRLYIHGINLQGDDLSWLPGLDRLEALSLRQTKIDGKALKNLTALKSLVVLNLSDNNINDGDLEQIAALKKLEVLSLESTKVTGAGIAHLQGMTSLNELNLEHCNIMDADLEYFLSMPNLRIVYAAGCNISDMGIQNVVARFPMLAIFR